MCSAQTFNLDGYAVEFLRHKKFNLDVYAADCLRDDHSNWIIMPLTVFGTATRLGWYVMPLTDFGIDIQLGWSCC